MTTSVIFCLSYDFSKWLFIAFKVDIFQQKMHCCHGRHHAELVLAESVNTCVVITLFMTRHYPLNNSDVI